MFLSFIIEISKYMVAVIKKLFKIQKETVL